MENPRSERTKNHRVIVLLAGGFFNHVECRNKSRDSAIQIFDGDSSAIVKNEGE
ncbi:hypothetical protein RYX36_023589, partial [Vicia faba]